MPSSVTSGKKFSISILLDEVYSLLLDFATSESCAGSAPPRMKKGRMAAGRVQRQRSVGYSRCEPDHQCDPGCPTSTTVCRSSQDEARKGAFDPGWASRRPSIFTSEGNNESRL